MEDHPRPCGEHRKKPSCTSSTMGSPPPMRGTLLFLLSILAGIRITPAHAGNTKITPTTDTQKQDHPRPCGEHVVLTVSVIQLRGSPPPMRGTRYLINVRLTRNRITPAHAGNTGINTVNNADSGDHPRPCGEHAIISTTTDLTTGSPPPMRGTLGVDIVTQEQGRITPAHAGNTIHRRHCKSA